MKNLFMKKASTILCVLFALSTPSFSQVKSYFGTTPDLKVSGKEFVDPNGRPVSLHGVMDTPNDYFNGGRWNQNLGWPVYGHVNAVSQCRGYFTKVFDALTKKGGQGSTYCNLFRLHLDPAWTNDPNKQATAGGQENDISRFSADRLRTYLKSLYIPIAEDALGHGLYVIIRPPGVFPENVSVGDAYNKYLMTVWDIVSQNEWVKAHPGQVMLELGNEPVNMNGHLADYFQPIVNKIRQNGFRGILLLPGTGWQANYRDYAVKGINDDNFAYAVHNYPGWYGGWDANQTESEFIYEFEQAVPVDKKPIVITEVDWSPMKQGAGHWNEAHNQYTEGNFGTWGTGTTNGAPNVPYMNTQNVSWGMKFKHLVDKYPNISWTLQGTTTYVDMDAYIAYGKIQPAFYDQMTAAGYPDANQACSGSCFDWYYQYACGDRVPMPAAGGGGSQTGGYSFDVVGNAYYDSNNKHYCFYTPFYSSFVFHDFDGTKLIECADFTMDCGTCTTGYRLDVQLKDSKGNIIKDGANDYIIGSEEKGTRVTKENANKIFNMQAIFADYIAQYPGCTIGDIRINTAIDGNDDNKQGLYYITINKMEMQISQVRVTTSDKSLADIPLIRHTQVDEQIHFADGDTGEMGGWGGTITCEDGIGTFKSRGYRLKNTKTNSWESQVCYSGNYVKGREYTLKMNVKGSVVGTISAGFQKSEGYEGRGDFGTYQVKTGYTEWKVKCTVTDEGADRLLINYGGFPGDLFIDNVEIYTEAKGDVLGGNNILLNKEATNGAEVFGAGLGGSVDYKDYADLTGYKKMTINGTGGSLRILANRRESGEYTELNPSLASGSATIDLTAYPTFHLNSIKSGWGQTVNISSITLSGKQEEGKIAEVYITGAGNITDGAKAVLNDERIKSIDITGMTNKFSQPLTSANPNCIMIYDAKQETPGYGEEENLMGSAFDARNLAKKDGNDSYSCWRTDLVDGYNFCSPVNITTVGGASFSSENTSEYASVVLPFALDLGNDNPDIFVLNEVNGNSLKLEQITSGTLPAGTAIIYRKNAEGKTTFNGYNIVKTVEGFNIQPLSGVSGWFTAQSFENDNIDNVAVHPILKDYDVYVVSDNALVRVSESLALEPFRALFLHKKTESPADDILYINGKSHDVNGDGVIDIVDAVLLIDYLNGNTEHSDKYDKNKVSKFNVSDVDVIVNHCLEKE